MYCPECGVECQNFAPNDSGSCYDCPTCLTHWTHHGHLDGSYSPTMPGSRCPCCESLILRHKTPNPMPKKVIIEVSGGVADVTSRPPSVEVEIIDHDNEACGGEQ